MNSLELSGYEINGCAVWNSYWVIMCFIKKNTKCNMNQHLPISSDNSLNKIY